MKKTLAESIVEECEKRARLSSEDITMQYAHFQGAMIAEITSLLDSKQTTKRLKQKLEEAHAAYDKLQEKLSRDCTKIIVKDDMAKARAVKRDKITARITTYQEQIKKIVSQKGKIKTKELIKLLEINNKTFYNLKLNEFYKSVI